MLDASPESLMETLRLADPATGRAYPLPVAGVADWHTLEDGFAVELALPPLAAGTLLIPSLAVSDAGTAYHQWTLCADGSTWRLPPTPADPATREQPPADPRASQHIDCWHIHAPLKDPVLRVWLRSWHPGAGPPDRYLICASARPLTLTEPARPAAAHALAVAPPTLSQMTAPPDLAPRICSPTSVAMVLAHWGCRDPWLGIVDECRDPATGMYGVWPLAIAAAARRGSMGAVEAFSNWDAPLAVLARGIPLVTSIRFEKDVLPDAPLPRTGGHLLVVFAAGPELIGVNDPAAPDLASVTRSYPAAAFTAAWLGHRGAAYIILPP
jgi:hypothetical protein